MLGRHGAPSGSSQHGDSGNQSESQMRPAAENGGARAGLAPRSATNEQRRARMPQDSATMVLDDKHITGNKNQITMWVQEAIYGHRYIDEQHPYMLVLEVLSICRSRLYDKNDQRSESGEILSHGIEGTSHESIQVSVPRQKELRTLLFNERNIDEFADASESGGGWEEWAKGLPEELGYIRNRFQASQFVDLYKAVQILRGFEVEVNNSRRWTSRFVVPRGTRLIFGDFSLKWVVDRRFFGRGGEMVYLMLNRSTRNRELSRKIEEWLERQRESQLNKLASALSPDPAQNPEEINESKIGYLPMAAHGSYDLMAEDWLGILSQEGIPDSQVLEPLARITGLNMIRYFAMRSAEVVGRENPEVMPLDLSGGTSLEFKRVAKGYLEDHRHAIGKATDKFIEDRLMQDPEWAEVEGGSDQGDRNRATEIISRVFHLKESVIREIRGRPPRDQRREFKKQVRKRSRNDIAGVILPLARHAGLVESRSGAGSWFCPNDGLLEAMVLANVEGIMTIGEFLRRLSERYGIVIGPTEARKAFEKLPCALKRFEENHAFFERRLANLGLLKRLSDDCAFVINPYGEGESHD